MKLKLLHLLLTTDKDIEGTPAQLRGFMGNQFEKHIELHHHIASPEGEAKLKYDYPRIQYSINRNKAILLGIEENAISVLRNVVMNVKELLLGSNSYEIIEINAHYEETEFGILNSGKLILYKFNSPWLALNSENYKKFTVATIKERRRLLKSILIGNILSMSKHLGYNVPDTIHVNIELSPIKVFYKDIPLVGFKGIFESNFLIPDYVGIGKAVSHGFGKVMKTNKS
ncbi:hypothetical protein LCGC14_0816990 [marine sediment metagenome]|uniref:Cas6b C-terminal domain-containing protein n=1 Tax=marine sediment metagenome TaxID=412755 RepID=A0A0F9SSF5_9ZZZZ